jgi:hypothetical protein
VFDTGQAAAPAAGWQESGDWTANARNGWRDDDRVPRIRLNLRTSDGQDRWGFGVRVTDLAGLPGAALDGDVASVRFTLPREAGTFTFTGSTSDGRGGGRYTFAPSAAYASAMAGLGFGALRREQTIRLAVMDVGAAFVKDIRELEALGFTGLGGDHLVRMRIHSVSAEFVRQARADGLRIDSPDDAVDLAIHGRRWRRR